MIGALGNLDAFGVFGILGDFGVFGDVFGNFDRAGITEEAQR